MVAPTSAKSTGAKWLRMIFASPFLALAVLWVLHFAWPARWQATIAAIARSALAIEGPANLLPFFSTPAQAAAASTRLAYASAELASWWGWWISCDVASASGVVAGFAVARVNEARKHA